MKKVLFLAAMAALSVSAAELTFTWKGKADKVSAPKVEEIKDEDWVSYRCTPTAEAPYQGFVGTPSEQADLSKYKGIALDIKQKCYPGNAATVLFIHTTNGNAYTSFNAGDGKDWKHVEIDFAKAKWQGPKDFKLNGKLTRVYIYPYASLDKPSKSIEIANFELIPQE
ncbi:MAG: hypothetical protein IJW33_05725 [Lentisphaeria bacterium]|nr:hypothetical protein [Lentisphaeria bacterium]